MDATPPTGTEQVNEKIVPMPAPIVVQESSVAEQVHHCLALVLLGAMLAYLACSFFRRLA